MKNVISVRTLEHFGINIDYCMDSMGASLDKYIYAKFGSICTMVSR